MKLRIALALALGAGLLAVGAPSYASSPACGATVTHNVKLKKNVRCTAGNGLVVGASNITINLNHHTISTTSVGQGNGVDATNFFGITVTNGKIRGFNNGVNFDGVIGGTISKIKAKNNLHNIRILESGSITITKNKTSGGDAAILTTSGSLGLTITNNKLSPGAGSGIRLNGTQFSTVAHNTIKNGQDRGIYLLAGANNNNVFGNSITTTTNAGIEIDNSKDNLIEGNRIKHAGTGIDIESAALANSQDNELQSNVITNSTTNGVNVVANVTATSIHGNTSDTNGANGFDIAASDPSTHIGGNTADNNTLDGILAVPTVTDDGGNRASGNGTANCVGVTCP